MDKQCFSGKFRNKANEAKQGAESRDRKQNQLNQKTSFKSQSKLVKQPKYKPRGTFLKSEMATSFPASAITNQLTVTYK